MKPRTVVLIDYTLIGHHLSFLRTFSGILLKQGHRVICLVPGVEVVEKWIQENYPADCDRFQGFEYLFSEKSYNSFGRLNDAFSVIRKWRHDAHQIRKIAAFLKVRVDLVFYAWVDTQLAGFIPSFLLDRIFPFKWTGLYFHPYHLRLSGDILNRKAVWRDWDSIFLSKNCIGVTVHDLGIQDAFARRINKPVIHFPETADDTAPDFSYPLYKEIVNKAAGRKVIGMIGCEAHKGTITYMNLAKMADHTRYFFVFLGVLPADTYRSEDWKELQSFIAEGRENCFFHFKPIPEGAKYNAVFCAFDIPFLVYDNFISSSNRLTKAAIFNRLVLASNNYCVGHDVLKYNLGEAVCPKDAGAALAGLERINKKIESNALPYQEWKLYQELNSNSKLYERFEEVISLVP